METHVFYDADGVTLEDPVSGEIGLGDTLDEAIDDLLVSLTRAALRDPDAPAHVAFLAASPRERRAMLAQPREMPRTSVRRRHDDPAFRRAYERTRAELRRAA